MNKEKIRLLVDALRSGKYKQARNRLKKTDKQRHPMYCCLGVGCLLAGLEAKPYMRNSVGGKNWMFDDSSTFLPERARLFFGFDKSDPKVKYDSHPEIEKAVKRVAKRSGRQYTELKSIMINSSDRTVRLSSLNDNAQMSFKEIATVIEREFLSQ